MKTLWCATMVLGLALVGCGKKDQPVAAKATNAPAESGNPITAPVDYLGAVGAAKKHAEKVIDTVSITQAVDLFHAQEDRFPKDLNELVTTHYLQSIPPAPYGMKITYDPINGQVKVVKTQ